MSQNEQTITRRIVTLPGALGGFMRKASDAGRKVTNEVKYRISTIKTVFSKETPGLIEEFRVNVPFQVVETKAKQRGEKDTYLVGQSVGWKAVTIDEYDEQGEAIMTQTGRAKQTRLLLNLSGDPEKGFTHKVQYMVTVMAVPLTDEDIRRYTEEGNLKAEDEETQGNESAAQPQPQPKGGKK
jgi:hypothetical protein